jgi:hypothetical protein
LIQVIAAEKSKRQKKSLFMKVITPVIFMPNLAVLM